MTLRLSVTMAESPVLLFLCQGRKQGSADADHGNNRHLNLLCHRTPWSSQRIPSSSISIIAIVKWSEEICQTSDNGPDKSDHILTATTSLSKGDVHSGCLLHSQINHHIIRNEEASCEKRHSKQSECQVSAIMSAATVPCRTRLSVKGHSVHSEK